METATSHITGMETTDTAETETATSHSTGMETAK